MPTNLHFTQKFAESIVAVLGCHDRVIFKGNYPLTVGTGIMYPEPLGKIMYFVPQNKESVGFLCADLPIDGRLFREPVGTCFFVSVWEQNRSSAITYLVTAKHIWRDFFKDGQKTFVRLNKVQVS